MGVALKVTIRLKRHSIFVDERINVISDITASGIDIENAVVTFSCSQGGTFDPSSGITNDQGNVISIFSPDSTATSTILYEITVSASKAGLDAGTHTIILSVSPRPIEYTTRDKEYHLLSHGIRERVLKRLREILDEDPDLYVSTGAISPPVYLNGFAYTTRDFPQVIATSTAQTARQMIINNYVGDGSTSYPSAGGEQNRGGWYDMILTITVIAESKDAQERLLDLCSMVLWDKQRMKLYAEDGILIIGVSAGPETTQPYGSRLLYAGAIRITCATEWFLKDRVNQTVNDIVLEPTIQSP